MYRFYTFGSSYFYKKSGCSQFIYRFFTATSATCVTGLIQVDTYTHWSFFGQGVILCLIQIGGIGFMTLCISIMTLTKRKIGLVSRSLMQNSVSAPQIGGIVKMTRFIIIGTFSIEFLGAFLLAFHFCPKFGLSKGIWFSIFHSISAFCNAGFDLMGSVQPFSSLTGEVGNWYVNLIIMALIIIGGLGFFVWRDILATKLHFHKMQLHTKLVLSVSLFLIAAGTLLLLYVNVGQVPIRIWHFPNRSQHQLFSLSVQELPDSTVLTCLLWLRLVDFWLSVWCWLAVPLALPPAESKQQLLPFWFFLSSRHFAAENLPKCSADAWKTSSQERQPAFSFVYYILVLCGYDHIQNWEHWLFRFFIWKCIGNRNSWTFHWNHTGTDAAVSRVACIFNDIRKGWFPYHALAFSFTRKQLPSALPLEKFNLVKRYWLWNLF